MIDQVMASAMPSERFSYQDRSRDMETYSFGTFAVFPAQRLLMRDGMAVAIGSRAFDLLVVLLRANSAIVSKDAIVRYVWPSTTVDEGNLRFQMTCLRRALGPERDRVKTIAGRGYMFIGATAPAQSGTATPHDGDLPAVAPPTVRSAAIVIIDEDPNNREALHRLLRPIDAYVQSFGSLEAFFASARGIRMAG